MGGGGWKGKGIQEASALCVIVQELVTEQSHCSLHFGKHDDLLLLLFLGARKNGP